MQYEHEQQEAAKAYEQKQTEYESVHNEPVSSAVRRGAAVS